MGSKRVFYGSGEEKLATLCTLLYSIQEYAEEIKTGLMMKLGKEGEESSLDYEGLALELINWNTKDGCRWEIEDGNLYFVVGEDNSERD